MVSRAKSAVVAAPLALMLGLVLGSTSTLGSARAPVTATVEPQFQAAGGTSEMSYVPVAPCRLVDTRLGGGKLAAGALRNFKARGTGSFAAQGGSTTGCGLPANAAAASVSVAAVKPASAGYLRSWAFSTAEPLSAFMNVSKNVTLAGFTNQDLEQPGALFDFIIRNGAGALHLVVDVTGYYIAPLAARVAANGTLIRGSRVTSVTRESIGLYTVVFDRDVSACYLQVTFPTAGLFASAKIAAEPVSGQPNRVLVAAVNSVPAVVDVPFDLTVTC